MMKVEAHMFKGMKRGNHEIRQDGQFLWDAHNIRITDRDDNTLLSITNEKGTLDTNVTFKGQYVGHCVLNNYLILFTADEDRSNNYIYRVEKINDKYRVHILFYEQEVTDYSWTPNYPIEAIGIYETEYIQKVYWIDGNNQPRVINIKKPEYILKDTKFSLLLDLDEFDFSNNAPGNDEQNKFNNEIPTPSNFTGDWNSFLEEYKREYPYIYKGDYFDFVRDLNLEETVTVNKLETGGQFSSGTIQYAFSYYNKYEQESNIWYTTPIYYISPKDRGGNPEEKVNNSFVINIWAPDQNFDFIRIYSIHRTSINSVPEVKVVTDIKCKLKDLGESVTFIDTGTTGYVIDPTQLLYIGGTSIIANSITHKDGTLFLGGITHIESDIRDKVYDILSNCVHHDLTIFNNKMSSYNNTESTYYNYSNSLYSKYSAGFMTNETYRLGYQVQYKNGKWSEPFYFDDKIITNKYPWETGAFNKSTAIGFEDHNNVIRKKLRDLGVRKIRACVVFPTAAERDVICQGVLCPTVYNVNGRKKDAPYAMSSWFFRPAVNMKDNSKNIYKGASIQFQHNRALFTGTNRGAEIQNMKTGVDTLDDLNKVDIDNYNSHFFVDENIVTFHSPDLEFDTSLSNYSWNDVSLNIIGKVSLGAIIGDIDIQTSSPAIGTTSEGFHHTYIGYQTKEYPNINGGLIMGGFYNDAVITSEFKTGASDKYWAVYPWHRTGSLNNDSKRPIPTDNKETNTNVRSAVLLRKKISNLKYFDRISDLSGENSNKINSIEYKISTPQLFNSNELSLVKLKPSYLNKEVPYFGNVDTLITSKGAYNLYCANNFDPKDNPDNDFKIVENGILESKDPVRMKYKSSPHLVFSLSGNENNEIPLLPKHAAIGNKVTNDNFKFPNWQNTGVSDDDFISTERNYVLWIYGCDELDTIFSHGSASEDRIGNVIMAYSIFNNKPVIRVVTRESKGITSRIIEGDVYFKAVPGVTILRNNNDKLPGTSDTDYSNKIYNGKLRYYKATKKEENGSIYHEIQEITPTENGSTTVTNYKITQKTFGDNDFQDIPRQPYLLIGNIIRKNNSDTKFGGKSEEALQQNLWVPAGRSISINDVNVTNTTDDTSIIIPFEYGDTWYSRYDCLKTYAFTDEDENQIIDIGSFMCETRVNIDGRYDKNRGQLSNINVSPINFNLFNEVYSQKDNFFNYRILDDSMYKQSKFDNQVTWSKEKHSGEEIDTWTNITLANTLDMNGDRGKITALKTWNESILCFQEKALNEILFNSRVQIPVSDGVPIEISNGYKVNGKRTFSDIIGCYNKWSIVATPYGLYFPDYNTNSIYLFNGNLTNLSRDNGMDWWVKSSKVNNIWSPLFTGINRENGIRTFYDSKYGDIYFTPGSVSYNITDEKEALCYSELLGQFTSFMSYGGAAAMFNFADGFYSLRADNENNIKLYKNNAGKYNKFYGATMPFSISFISNEEPLLTKTFDTIEIESDVYSNDNLTNKMPFNSILAENEYQNSGICEFDDNPMSIRKKFRVWRINIPRSNYVASKLNNGEDIIRYKYGRARIRNPWTKITLSNSGEYNEKTILHNIAVKYSI